MFPVMVDFIHHDACHVHGGMWRTPRMQMVKNERAEKQTGCKIKIENYLGWKIIAQN